MRIRGVTFQQMVSSVLDDLSRYTNELAEKQLDFKERLAPQLAAVLGPWLKM